MINVFKSLIPAIKTLSKGELYDQQTAQIIKKVCQKKNTNCVDIGANKGDILKIMLKHAPRGHHFAFEPIPSLHQELAKKFASESCTVLDYALSHEPGTSSFHYVVSNDAYSGLKQREYGRKNEQIELITVKTERLDNVLPSDYRVDLIKIDVEGGELPVLRGAVNTIGKYKPVLVFEHGTGASEFYGSTPEDLFTLLQECGLRVFTLEAWLNQQNDLSVDDLRRIYDLNEEWYFVASA